MKERTKRIKSWSELVDFVESINPNKETIALTGWINNLYLGKTYVRELVFTTKPIDVLKNKETKKSTKKLKK